MLTSILFISLGASLGATLRYMVGKGLAEYPTFISTFSVNCLGSLLMGFCMVFIQKKFTGEVAQTLNLVLLIGFLGSFTTFSAFSRDIYFILEKGFFHLFLLVGTQVSVGFVLFWGGMKLAEKMFP